MKNVVRNTFKPAMSLEKNTYAQYVNFLECAILWMHSALILREIFINNQKNNYF